MCALTHVKNTLIMTTVVLGQFLHCGNFKSTMGRNPTNVKPVDYSSDRLVIKVMHRYETCLYPYWGESLLVLKTLQI